MLDTLDLDRSKVNQLGGAIAPSRPLAAFGSLLCDAPDLIPGDTSRFQFADGVHPTPYAHALLAEQVGIALRAREWLQ